MREEEYRYLNIDVVGKGGNLFGGGGAKIWVSDRNVQETL